MVDTKKAIPEVEFEFMGQKRLLKFSTKAFCLLEDKTGKNALDGETWAKPDVRVLTTILWAGLITHMPELTLDQVRDEMSLPELLGVYATINQAFLNASPTPDEKKSDQAAA